MLLPSDAKQDADRDLVAAATAAAAPDFLSCWVLRQKDLTPSGIALNDLEVRRGVNSLIASCSRTSPDAPSRY